MKKSKKALIWLAILGAWLIWSPSFSQNKENVKNNAKKELVNLGWKEVSHETIIKMNFTDILKIYGKEKWMNIIRENFLVEINNNRIAIGNKPLKLHFIVDKLAQDQAQDMANNDHFSHIDKNGKSASDKMIEDGRYNYKIYASNISFNISTIVEVVQSYIDNNKRNTGHYDVISVNTYEDLWVGLAKGKNGIWFIVINYGKEFKKNQL